MQPPKPQPMRSSKLNRPGCRPSHRSMHAASAAGRRRKIINPASFSDRRRYETLCPRACRPLSLRDLRTERPKLLLVENLRSGIESQHHSHFFYPCQSVFWPGCRGAERPLRLRPTEACGTPHPDRSRSPRPVSRSSLRPPSFSLNRAVPSPTTL